MQTVFRISSVLHHPCLDQHLCSAGARPTLARHKATIAFAAEQAFAQPSQPIDAEDEDAIRPGMQPRGDAWDS